MKKVKFSILAAFFVAFFAFALTDTSSIASTIDAPFHVEHGMTVYGTAENGYNNLGSENGVLVSAANYQNTIVVGRDPYAVIYSYNSKGQLVPTKRALAKGSVWKAHLGASGHWWVVGTNQYIRLGDAA